MRIQGVSVNKRDASSLASALEELDKPATLAAAAKIRYGLLEQVDVNLTQPERKAVLAQLVNPPDGLSELRRTLSA